MAATGLFAIAVSTSCSSTKAAKTGDAAGDAAGGGERPAESIRQKQSGNEKVSEFDLNGDKRPDVWTYTTPGKSADGKDIEKLVRKELDINWDGRVDIARSYDEREQMEREALDLDFDGRVDQVNYYEKSIIVRKERDLSSAGRPSLWLFYEKGKLVRKERDTNGDGKVDYWEYWEGEQVDRVGEDLDGDGNVDKWTKNPNAEG